MILKFISLPLILVFLTSAESTSFYQLHHPLKFDPAFIEIKKVHPKEDENKRSFRFQATAGPILGKNEAQNGVQFKYPTSKLNVSKYENIKDDHIFVAKGNMNKRKNGSAGFPHASKMDSLLNQNHSNSKTEILMESVAKSNKYLNFMGISKYGSFKIPVINTFVSPPVTNFKLTNQFHTMSDDGGKSFGGKRGMTTTITERPTGRNKDPSLETIQFFEFLSNLRGTERPKRKSLSEIIITENANFVKQKKLFDEMAEQGVRPVSAVGKNTDTFEFSQNSNYNNNGTVSYPNRTRLEHSMQSKIFDSNPSYYRDTTVRVRDKYDKDTDSRILQSTSHRLKDNIFTNYISNKSGIHDLEENLKYTPKSNIHLKMVQIKGNNETLKSILPFRNNGPKNNYSDITYNNKNGFTSIKEKDNNPFRNASNPKWKSKIYREYDKANEKLAEVELVGGFDSYYKANINDNYMPMFKYDSHASQSSKFVQHQPYHILNTNNSLDADMLRKFRILGALIHGKKPNIFKEFQNKKHSPIENKFGETESNALHNSLLDHDSINKYHNVTSQSVNNAYNIEQGIDSHDIIYYDDDYYDYIEYYDDYNDSDSKYERSTDAHDLEFSSTHAILRNFSIGSYLSIIPIASATKVLNHINKNDTKITSGDYLNESSNNEFSSELLGDSFQKYDTLCDDATKVYGKTCEMPNMISLPINNTIYNRSKENLNKNTNKSNKKKRSIVTKADQQHKTIVLAEVLREDTLPKILNDSTNISNISKSFVSKGYSSIIANVNMTDLMLGKNLTNKKEKNRYIRPKVLDLTEMIAKLNQNKKLSILEEIISSHINSSDHKIFVDTENKNLSMENIDLNSSDTIKKIIPIKLEQSLINRIEKAKQLTNKQKSTINIGNSLNISILETLPHVTKTLKAFLLKDGISLKKVTDNDVKDTNITAKDVSKEVVRERIKLLRLLKEHKSSIKHSPFSRSNHSYLQVRTPVKLFQVLNGDIKVATIKKSKDTHFNNKLKSDVKRFTEVDENIDELFQQILDNGFVEEFFTYYLTINPSCEEIKDQEMKQICRHYLKKIIKTSLTKRRSPHLLNSGSRSLMTNIGMYPKHAPVDYSAGVSENGKYSIRNDRIRNNERLVPNDRFISRASQRSTATPFQDDTLINMFLLQEPLRLKVKNGRINRNMLSNKKAQNVFSTNVKTKERLENTRTINLSKNNFISAKSLPLSTKLLSEGENDEQYWKKSTFRNQKIIPLSFNGDKSGPFQSNVNGLSASKNADTDHIYRDFQIFSQNDGSQTKRNLLATSSPRVTLSEIQKAIYTFHPHVSPPNRQNVAKHHLRGNPSGGGKLIFENNNHPGVSHRYNVDLRESQKIKTKDMQWNKDKIRENILSATRKGTDDVQSSKLFNWQRNVKEKDNFKATRSSARQLRI